jgi:hypothetical protein
MAVGTDAAARDAAAVEVDPQIDVAPERVGAWPGRYGARVQPEPGPIHQRRHGRRAQGGAGQGALGPSNSYRPRRYMGQRQQAGGAAIDCSRRSWNPCRSRPRVDSKIFWAGRKSPRKCWETMINLAWRGWRGWRGQGGLAEVLVARRSATEAGDQGGAGEYGDARAQDRDRDHVEAEVAGSADPAGTPDSEA